MRAIVGLQSFRTCVILHLVSLIILKIRGTVYVKFRKKRPLCTCFCKIIRIWNGSILDGIDLWQSNVRKKFDGVEECAICYSIVHNTNFSLPKMRCHTCRKLFHYACMYKWFTTSRNPACPLCRHLFIDPTGRPVST
ncbi:unnamed protein product [Schistosoma curassoni]|uniref:E3 ubiquitin-protein ligase listerin n=1 Tax=Schistosoma curassoni TaxID=6186 RepID=A0A183JJ61_9TREM|nr:unnamed protein product [Schistosoma curassoni]